MKLSGAEWNNLNTIKIKSNLMAGVKSVQMFHDVFHDVFHENSVNNKEDREGLTKLFKWNIHVKNNMIINCVDWKDVNKRHIYPRIPKIQRYDVPEEHNYVYVRRRSEM